MSNSNIWSIVMVLAVLFYAVVVLSEAIHNNTIRITRIEDTAKEMQF